MKTTDKEVCNILVDVLLKHGVKRAVVSPGSRNAPLLVALSREDGIEKTIIVDERSAAFVALGMAQQTGEPVVIVCTSGTALLNYAPAVAEAYYQKLPLIVVSADRPKEWIDQDDSQTIRQFEALSQFVKRSYDLPARCADDVARWYADRVINDALMEAKSGRCAPVHINIQLDEPLSGSSEWSRQSRGIELISPSADLSDSDMSRLVEVSRGCRILVIAGFMRPDEKCQKALERLSEMPNVAVLTETISNMRSPRFISAIDRTLIAMEEAEEYVPDLLITIGGAIVSRMVKTFLRHNKPKYQWYVGVSDVTVDCMQSLTTRIQTDAGSFLSQFADVYCKMKEDGDFANRWQALAEKGLARHCIYVQNAPWSDMKAHSVIFKKLSEQNRSIMLQFSNGTTIRYAQLFGDLVKADNYCNRGVSGIDGSTSTALGASLAFYGLTVLITGDMSFGYDLSGLASRYNTKNFKIIVINNSGGGIFRFVKSTATLPELEEYLECQRELPVKKYSDAFGFCYYEAENETELNAQLSEFLSVEQPAILSVKTDSVISGETLKNYFKKI
jgi:2-succinyl-5-enolpyruvyl-6-hydroxy-3-cyclohexene-1-carboxylate synthase